MKKYIFLAVVTISFFFGLVQMSIASAANVCVGPSPSGNGSGSDWNNIAEWSTVTLTRGNTYYLQDGTYGNKILSTAISGQTYIYIKKATVSAHGTDTGWSSIYGDGVATFDTASLTITSDYWDIDGVTGGGPGNWKTGFGIAFTSVAGADLEYINLDGRSYIFIHHISFVQVGDTTVYNSGASAFYAANPIATISNSTFEYLYFDNLGRLPFMFRNGSNNIIQYNYSGDVCGMSVHNPNDHCEVLVSWGMSQVDFRYNYLDESPSTGGYVMNNLASTDVRIYGNIFNTGNPISCNTGSCTDWVIVNNTFVRTGSGPMQGDGTVRNLIMSNNIVFDAITAWIGSYAWLSRVKGSCTSGADENTNVTVRMPYNCDLYYETVDPFVNSLGHLPEDFLLTAPLIGWPGTDVCALDSCNSTKKFNYDMFGAVRGGDGVWDRGAIEYVQAGDKIAPAAPTGLVVR